MECKKCKENSGVEFECVDCCVRWLVGMKDDEYRKTNAPFIAAAVSKEHLDAVRAAYKIERLNVNVISTPELMSR